MESCIPLNRNAMKDGSCVMTYNWGNSFQGYLQGESVLKGKYGVAPTPGSTKVLDRKKNALVNCTSELCPYATWYEDIGLVNYAPYLAFGGWVCSVNNYTSSTRKRLAMEFCQYISSRDVSMDSIIINATDPNHKTGQDPYRSSHLDQNALNMYVQNGYERETTQDFLNTIQSTLSSSNVVTDIRFPKSLELMNVLGDAVQEYLNMETEHSDRRDCIQARKNVKNNVITLWKNITDSYDKSRQGNQRSLLESYQRLRGVYNSYVDYNYIGKFRIFGDVLLGITLFMSLSLAVWVHMNRKSHAIRSSQPMFLIMVCVGTAIMGLTILPMGIDDEDDANSISDDGISKHSGCNVACMSIPWLLACGWTIIYSALASKLWRINQVMNSAYKFRRLKVSEKGVLPFFVSLLSVNVVLLTIWTTLYPIRWVRKAINDTTSVGKCTFVAGDDNGGWNAGSIIVVSLLAITNFAALVIANFQAYRARNISTEYGESKYIAISMGSLLQSALVGVPLLFLVEESNPVASYFLRSSLVFMVSMSILVLILVPKVSAWYNHEYLGEPINRSSHPRSSRLTSATFDAGRTSEFGFQDPSSVSGLKFQLNVSSGVENQTKLSI